MTCPRRLVRDAARQSSATASCTQPQSFKPRRYSRDCPRAAAAPARLADASGSRLGFQAGLSPGPTPCVVPFLLHASRVATDARLPAGPRPPADGGGRAAGGAACARQRRPCDALDGGSAGGVVDSARRLTGVPRHNIAASATGCDRFESSTPMSRSRCRGSYFADPVDHGESAVRTARAPPCPRPRAARVVLVHVPSSGFVPVGRSSDPGRYCWRPRRNSWLLRRASILTRTFAMTHESGFTGASWHPPAARSRRRDRVPRCRPRHVLCACGLCSPGPSAPGTVHGPCALAQNSPGDLDQLRQEIETLKRDDHAGSPTSNGVSRQRRGPRPQRSRPRRPGPHRERLPRRRRRPPRHQRQPRSRPGDHATSRASRLLPRPHRSLRQHRRHHAPEPWPARGAIRQAFNPTSR